MDEVRDTLREATVAGPADARAIAAAEGKLGLSFPSDYKSFLATYGAAVGQGYEIAGLVPASEEPPFWTDVVTFTLQQRKASRGTLPNHYIALSSDGGDFIFFLDTSKGDARGVCPVLIWGPGSDGEVFADGFVDFVVRRARETS